MHSQHVVVVLVALFSEVCVKDVCTQDREEDAMSVYGVLILNVFSFQALRTQRRTDECSYWMYRRHLNCICNPLSMAIVMSGVSNKKMHCS